MSDKELAHLIYDPSFRASNPTGLFVGEFTAAAQNYRHEWMEGCDQAYFDLDDSKGAVSDTTLRGWFERRLMWRIVTRLGDRVVWDGYISSMDLERDGTHWRKAIDDMANAITVTYSDGVGGIAYIDNNIDTDVVWYTDEESIKLYGRREKVISINSESENEAEKRAAAEIKYLSSPYATAPTFRTTNTNRLTVAAIGRPRLANNIQLLGEKLRLTEAHIEANENDDNDSGELTYAYGNETTISAEILRIVELVDELAGWIYPLDIAQTNDIVTLMGVPSTMGAWDRILELARLQDERENFYQLTVEPDGGVTYRIFEETPDYYYKPEPSRIVFGNDTPVRWEARPGIIRVVDSSIGPTLPDTWLKDKRNLVTVRVSMRDGDDSVSFHGRNYGVTDYLNAYEANKRRLEQYREALQRKKDL